MSAADILQKIVAEKWREIPLRKSMVSQLELQQRIALQTPPRGFVAALNMRMQNKSPAIIAEIKKASPSKGLICENFEPARIARSYEAAGAACLSVLTDVSFFQGADEYLQQARQVVELPVLRKDFVVDAYQVYEARSLGADCILLIVAILEPAVMASLYQLAVELGMDVLIEVHDAQELEQALRVSPTLVGINNRDLRDFSVDLDTTYQLLEGLPASVRVITESGISQRADVAAMQAHGVYGFLVGEAFMRHENPGAGLRELFF
jgi:indole-3-glycerol phosphate synthase